MSLQIDCNNDKYKNKGLSGLANLGNTCFLNSTIQCLSHCYELNNFLNKENYTQKLNKIPDSLILIEWDKLRKLMWSENCVISPNGFVKAVQRVARIKDKDIFTGFAQNDLTEFLGFVIDSFNNSVKREVAMNITGHAETNTDILAKNCFEMMKKMYSKEYSEFIDLFYGIHVSQIKSIESDYINVIPEPFFNISIPLTKENKPHHIMDCFDLYTKTEIMENENRIFNDKTQKKEKAEKCIWFWSLPHVLVVTLKRFNVSTTSIRKNHAFVDFEDTLDLSKYVIGYNKKSYVYELFGICNHTGGVHGGHYTSYVKNANSNWYHFNDTNVSRIPDFNTMKTNQAYCFFYRKKK